MNTLNQILSDSSDLIATMPKPRLQRINQELSRLPVYEANALACKTAIQRLIVAIYDDRDELNRPVNVRHNDGLLLVPAPWGSHGHLRYEGMTRTHADVLRLSLMEDQEKRPPLFLYSRRSWAANIFDYQYKDAALKWLEGEKINRSWWKTWYESLQRRRGAQ